MPGRRAGRYGHPLARPWPRQRGGGGAPSLRTVEVPGREGRRSQLVRQPRGCARSGRRKGLAMPAEERDLAVLRGLYTKWAVGNCDSVEEFAEDVVWIPVDLIGGGEFRGIDELSEQWRGWLQTFSDGFRIEADEIISRGGGRYVVMQTFRGIGRVSGVETVG